MKLLITVEDKVAWNNYGTVISSKFVTTNM